MVLPHNRKSPVSETKPRPVGVSDRNGQVYYLDEMVFQYQYSGRGLIDQRILIGPDEVDTPAPFLQTFIFGPEPKPLPNARPWHYAEQSQGGEPPLNTVSEILDTDGET
jgi:hypothetical protein